MHNDDAPVGRLLTRRELLALFGAAGLAAAIVCSDEGQTPPARTVTGGALTPPAVGNAQRVVTQAPACVAQPALTEGPFFVDEKLNRSDIRTDTRTGAASPGLPLALMLVVSRASASCEPLAGATVDLWQCDATGAYSDASDPTFDTTGKDFLRGYQVTDGEGRVRFTTIYPGWYPGRAVHVHFKIRTPTPGGATGEFTSQLFFDDALTDGVHAAPPYASMGKGRVRNEADAFYKESGGVLTLAAVQSGEGYEAAFQIAMKPPA
jgi:protocatechuate 3,4-dioxygenase beta subunit